MYVLKSNVTPNDLAISTFGFVPSSFSKEFVELATGKPQNVRRIPDGYEVGVFRYRPDVFKRLFEKENADGNQM